MGLLLEELNVLLAGDAVKNGWQFIRGLPPLCFHTTQAALESYAKVRSIAGIVIPGHDRPFRLLEGDQIEYLGQWSATIDSFADPGAEAKSHTLL